MSEMRSSVGYKSNIFPVGDPPFSAEFCSAVNKPAALEALYREISHYGFPHYNLSETQNKLREMAVPCVYSPPGDFPWGMEQVAGPVVCKCRQTHCPNFRKCTRGANISGT